MSRDPGFRRDDIWESLSSTGRSRGDGIGAELWASPTLRPLRLCVSARDTIRVYLCSSVDKGASGRWLRVVGQAPSYAPGALNRRKARIVARKCNTCQLNTPCFAFLGHSFALKVQRVVLTYRDWRGMVLPRRTRRGAEGAAGGRSRGRAGYATPALSL